MKEPITEQFLNYARRFPYSLQKMLLGIQYKREYARWEKNGKPLPPARIIKQETIDKYLKSTGYSVLIETGTYKGDMVFAQLKKFKKIFSIELDKKLFESAVRRFNNYPHVHIIQGDSAEKLKDIIDGIEEPAIIWLDGHYSGGFTAMGEKVTPIFEELKAIFRKKMNHAVLIDDARLFNGRDGYPAFDELKNFILQHHPGLQINVNDDCIQFVLHH